MKKLEIGATYKVEFDGEYSIGHFTSKLLQIDERKRSDRNEPIYDLRFENGVSMTQTSDCSFEKTGKVS